MLSDYWEEHSSSSQRDSAELILTMFTAARHLALLRYVNDTNSGLSWPSSTSRNTSTSTRIPIIITICFKTTALTRHGIQYCCIDDSPATIILHGFSRLTWLCHYNKKQSQATNYLVPTFKRPNNRTKLLLKLGWLTPCRSCVESNQKLKASQKQESGEGQQSFWCIFCISTFVTIWRERRQAGD